MGVRALSDSGQARSAVRARLGDRLGEIEEAALTRVAAITDPGDVSDPAYREGLRTAVGAAVAYGIETIGHKGGVPPVPVALLAQARMAARVGIPLDTVLRRYFAGYSLLGFFILEEASNVGVVDGAELQRLLGAHAGIFDRLLSAIGEEHARETEALRLSAGRRKAERIERLLAGELIDTSEIAYDFDAWHIGVVADGAGAERSIREFAAAQDCRPLILPRGGSTVWAWLGSRRQLDPEGLLHLLHRDGSCGGDRSFPAIALGEPGQGLSGWRLTHRQAAAALPVARSRGSVVRYADVALLAAAAQDNLLADSLRLYLEPLEGERDGGESARKTLRAYIAANRNVISAAAAMGITRQSARGRLRTIEDRIGRGLDECAAEIDIALQLRELDRTANRRVAP